MKKIFLFLAVAVAAIACKPEETVTPEVKVLSDASALVIEQEGGEVLIDFDANVEWTAEFKDASAADWCSLSPKSGAAGANKVKVVAIENATNENREVVVVIKAQTAQAEATVTQLQKDALVAGAASYDVPAEAGELKVKLGRNVDFEVKTDADWLTYVPTKAYVESELVFNVAANTALEARTAKITITAGALKQEVTVNQAAFVPTFEMDATELWLAVEGGTAELNITANFEYKLSVEADWLTVTNEGGKYTFTATANSDFYYRAVEVVITGWSSEENKFYVFQNGRAEDTWIKYTNTDYNWTLAADKARFAIVGDYILCANGSNVIKVIDAKTGAFIQDKTLPEGMNINMLTTDDAGNIVAGYEVAGPVFNEDYTIQVAYTTTFYYLTSLEAQPQVLGELTNEVYSGTAGNLRVSGDVTKNATLMMYANLSQYYIACNVVNGVMEQYTTAALPESDKTVWNSGHCVVFPLGDNTSKGAVYTGYTKSYDVYYTPDMQTWTSVASGVFNGNDNPNSMDIAVVNGKTYLAIGVGTHFSYTQARIEVLDVTDWTKVTKVGQWRLPDSSTSWAGAAGAWSDVAIVPTTGDSFDLYYFGANNQVIARVAVK